MQPLQTAIWLYWVKLKMQLTTDLVVTVPSTRLGVSFEILIHIPEEQVQKQLYGSVCDHKKLGATWLSIRRGMDK